MSPYARRAWVEIGRLLHPARAYMSPYARRAWVEILPHREHFFSFSGRPTHVGRGLKWSLTGTQTTKRQSPYARRAWVEIQSTATLLKDLESPYARRAWVEITQKSQMDLTLVVTLRT